MTAQLELPSPQVSAPPFAGEEASAHLRRRAVRGGTLLLATRLGTQIFSWVGTLLVARILRPYDYGLMTTGMVVVGLADLLAEAGVGKALVQKAKLERRDLAEGFTLSLLLGTALYAALFLLAVPAAEFLETPDFTGFLRVLALMVLLIPFRAVPLAILERDLRLGSQSAVHVLCAALQIGLVLALAVAGFGYWALAGGALAARVVETLAFTHAAGWRPRLAWPSIGAGSLLSFGLHVSGASLLWFIYSNADYAIIGKLAGPVALGYYALAFQLISLPVQKLTANVNQVAYPVFCRLQHDRGRLRDWYLRLTVLLSFVGAPALAGMALVAEDGFGLVFGDRWLPAIQPFQLLSLVGIFMVLGASVPPVLNALGRPDINLRYTGTCTLLFPPGFVLAGLSHGVVGVCLVWLVFYPVVVAGLVHATRGLTGISLLDVARVQRPVILGLIVMAGVVVVAQWLLAACSTGCRLPTTIAAGVLSYAGFMLVCARHSVLADVRLLLREFQR
jgi:O-antigen/teichoic acid export membrane protein